MPKNKDRVVTVMVVHTAANGEEVIKSLNLKIPDGVLARNFAATTFAVIESLLTD